MYRVIATYGLDIVTAKKKATPVLLGDIEPEFTPQKGIIRGKIIHIDRFGNCITNLHESDLKNNQKSCEIHITGHTIYDICQFYAQVDAGKPIAYMGSSGFLEIGVREGDAHKQLKIHHNTEFFIKNLKNIV